MALPKYVNLRGGVYQFARRVPKDIVGIIGKEFWRVSLLTDSLSEAEAKSHHEIIRTEGQIKAAREGTLRKIDDDTLFDWSMHWSLWFEENAQITLPEAVFGSRFPEALAYNGSPIGDEIDDPIITSRTQLAKQVKHFIKRVGYQIDIPSADWERLLNDCQDQYHQGNPEVTKSSFFRTMGPADDAVEASKLRFVFEEFTSERTRLDAEDPVTSGTLKDYGLAVERFIELFGDKDVDTITRSDAEKFRNLLRRLPSRPPDAVRALTIEERANWAERTGHKLLSRETVAKHVTGLLSILNFAHAHTSLIKDRKNWENPFKGFAGTGKRSSSAKRLPIGPDQIPKIFDPSKFRPRKPSHFWVPLILLYTGARRDEIAQLHLADVHLDADIPFFKISPEVDESIDLTKNPEATKRVKTGSSARVAPLHSTLIEIGLAELFDWAKDQNSIHLFPDLPHEKGNDRSNKLSTSFTKHLRNHVGLTDSRYVMHSLRHGFATMAMRSNVSDDRRKLALGWYVGGEVAVADYALHFRDDVAGIKEHVLDQMPFPELDIKGLRECHLQTLNYRCR